MKTSRHVGVVVVSLGAWMRLSARTCTSSRRLHRWICVIAGVGLLQAALLLAPSTSIAEPSPTTPPSAAPPTAPPPAATPPVAAPPAATPPPTVPPQPATDP